MARLHVTGENVGPLLDILTWLFLIATVIVVLMRLSLKKFVIGGFGFEDVFIVISAMSAVAQSILLVVSTGNGLGQISANVASAQHAAAFMAFYISQILFLSSLFFSKFSLVVYLYTLCPIAGHRQAIKVTGALTVAWGLSSVFLLAFQCPLPTPWILDMGKCLDLVAVIEYILIFSMITDLALTLHPIVIVTSLQTKKAKKSMLSAVFALRVSVIAGTVAQIVYGVKALRSHDILWHLWPVVICTQVIQFLSILTTSTIYLRPCFKILQSGFYQAGDLKRQHVEAFGFKGPMSSAGSKASPNQRPVWWSPWRRQRSPSSSQAETLSPRWPPPGSDPLRRNENIEYRTSVGPGPPPDLLDSFNASQILRTAELRVERSV